MTTSDDIIDRLRQDIDEYQNTLRLIKKRRGRIENEKRNGKETAERLRSAREKEKLFEDVIRTSRIYT